MARKSDLHFAPQKARIAVGPPDFEDFEIPPQVAVLKLERIVLVLREE